MADAWYYADNGQPMGPVSGADLRELAKSGGIKPTDLVWQAGMSLWAPAASMRGVFSPSPSTTTAPESTPPAPSAALPDAKPSALGRTSSLSSFRRSRWGFVAGIVFGLVVLTVIALTSLAVLVDAPSNPSPVAQLPAPPQPPLPPQPAVKEAPKKPPAVAWQPPPKQAEPPPRFKKGGKQKGGPVEPRSYKVDLVLKDQQHIQTLTFQKNESVRITVTTNSWRSVKEPDVHLVVLGPDGLKAAADESPHKDCAVTFVAGETGIYRVVVKLNSGNGVKATVRY